MLRAATTLFAMTLALIGCGRDPSRITDPLERADYVVARDHDPDAYYERAQLRLERGMLDGALADSDASVADLDHRPLVRNANFDACQLRARIHQARGETEAALADTALMNRQCKPDQPWDVATVRRLRIDLLIALGRLPEAEEMIAPMFAGGPTTIDFNVALGLLAKVYSARK